MTAAKVTITFGSLSFSGEGEENWLTSQLDKVLEKAETLAASGAGRASAHARAEDEARVGGGDTDVGILASFLTRTQASTNQVRRFLATAEWLHRKGTKQLKTRDVTKALQDNHQKRLGNPADCLARLVGKGHADKIGSEFYVTDEGRASLSIE
jgi:hypothetical protein